MRYPFGAVSISGRNLSSFYDEPMAPFSTAMTFGVSAAFTAAMTFGVGDDRSRSMSDVNGVQRRVR